MKTRSTVQEKRGERRISIEFDPKMNRYTNEFILLHHTTRIYSELKKQSKVMCPNRKDVIQTGKGEASKIYFEVK